MVGVHATHYPSTRTRRQHACYKRLYRELGQSYAYDPYGNLTNSRGSIANQFQGQLLDATSGLYYLRARWYDPSGTGFIPTDRAVRLTRRAHVYANDSPLDAGDSSEGGRALTDPFPVLGWSRND